MTTHAIGIANTTPPRLTDKARNILWKFAVHLRCQKALLSPPSHDVLEALLAKINSSTIQIKLDATEPLENLKKAPGLSDPIMKCSRFVPYERFKHQLLKSFSGTLQMILQSPKEERSYIMIGDSPDKSTNWVDSHLLSLMHIHPPEAIISLRGRSRYEISMQAVEKYLEANPTIKHIVFVDDAAYSGAQICSVLTKLGDRARARDVHICIPYRTQSAEDRMKEIGLNLIFSGGQRMLSYAEMNALGFYGRLPDAALPEGSESRTGTWLAHKSADDGSTDFDRMKQAASDQEAVVPYKYDSTWGSTEEPKHAQLARLGAQPVGPFSNVFFVHTNRGAFLVSDNYIFGPQSTGPTLRLTSNHNTLPFGGPNGAPQFKLSENDIVTLEQLDGPSATFIYQDGTLKAHDLEKLPVPPPLS